jgi:hypothetical protein
MATAKPYRFALKQGPTDYFYIDPILGTVATQNTPIYLDNAPKNWQSVAIEMKRGWDYNALFRLFSNNYEFVKDAAIILRWCFYLNQGPDSREIFFQVEKFNYDKSVWDYEPFIEEELDLSANNVKDTDDTFICKMAEGGFFNKLNSRAQSTHEIDLINHPDRVWVKMDGIYLNAIVGWTSLVESFTQAFTAIYLPKLSYYDTEGVNNTLIAMTVDQTTSQSLMVKNPAGGSGDTDITIKTKFSFDVLMDPGNTSNGELQFRYRYVDLSGPTFVGTELLLSLPGLIPGSTTPVLINDTRTVTLLDNHALELQIYVDDGSGGGGTNNYQINTLAGCKVDISFKNRAEATYIPALRPAKVFEELIDYITDGDSGVSSSLLTTTHNDKVITGGDGLRLLENSKLKINFEDFYQFIDNQFFSCLYYDRINDEAVIEARDFAYDTASVIATLPTVKNFQCLPLTERLFTRIKAGFKEYTYDDVNGKYEFNQSTEYTSVMIKTKNELDISSVIRCDITGMEYTRLNLTGKESTDSDTDNECFCIHIESAPAGVIPAGVTGAGEDYYEVYRTTINLTPGASYFKISNFDDPETLFNLFFSAKRQLARYGGYISGINYLRDNDSIQFNSSTKNNSNGTKLKTEEGSPVVTIDEALSEFIGTYNPPLFFPYLFKFDCAEPTNFFSILSGQIPTGVIRFYYKGTLYEGFPLDIKTKPHDLDVQEFLLLASPNCDLSKLTYR